MAIVHSCLHFLLRTLERLCVKNSIFASIYLLQHCLQNCRGQNQDYHHKFHSVQLRSAEYGWNNVGKLEIVFKRAWLVMVVPPNSCSLFSEILEVLELNFHFITMHMMSLLSLVQVPVLEVNNV